jgi:hypothetical protein
MPMKIKISTNLKKESRGQSLVELAISLMVLLLLLLGAVETSLAIFQYITIRDAAQEGAVYGSFEPGDENGIKYRAVDAASDILIIDPCIHPHHEDGDDDEDDHCADSESENKSGSVDVVFNGSHCEGIEDNESNTITVTIKFPHYIAFPLVTPILGTDKIDLTASVTNTILYPRCD